MFRVWADMHQGDLQQKLLGGACGTLERRNTVRLEEAWLAWSATTWAEGDDSHIAWDFASGDGIERTLCCYDHILRERHFLAVVAHITDCPRCAHMIALVSDGKKGAGRRVCANMNKFKLFPDLKVAIRTGCEDHADSNNLYCLSCDAELSTNRGQAGAELGQTAILEARVILEEGIPDLQYMVQCQDGSAMLLRRDMVREELLRTFETKRRVRKSKQLRKPAFIKNVKRARRR
eukprot:4405490-Karenia_brevis.AAC.1